MSKLENTMEFQPSYAKVWFQSDDFESGYDYIEIDSGYELDSLLRDYYTNNINNLFDDVYHALLFRIEYFHKTQDVNFEMKIGMDDAPNIELSFNTDKLKGFNSKGLSLIRDIIDYNNETENTLLKKLVENY